MNALNAVDQFLNAPKSYRFEEPTRKAQLIALVERELVLCETEDMRQLWLQKKVDLEAS